VKKEGKIQAFCFQTGKSQENCSEAKSYKINLSIDVCLMTIQKQR
jgi:hypothetical protein